MFEFHLHYESDKKKSLKASKWINLALFWRREKTFKILTSGEKQLF